MHSFEAVGKFRVVYDRLRWLDNETFGCVNRPVTGLEWPRGFQEVKVPRFHDNGTGWW